MEYRTFVTTISVLVLTASIAFSGGSIVDPGGKPSDGDCGETQGGENGDGTGDNSDPINLSTGGFQHHETDLVIPGRGLDFEFKRYYRSFSGLQAYKDGQQNFTTGPFIDVDKHAPIGQHWDFNYNMRLSFSANPVQELPFTPDPIDPVNLNQGYPGVIRLSTGKGRVENFNRYAPDTPTLPLSEPAYYSNQYYQYRIEYTLQERAVFMTDANMTTYKFFAGYDFQENQKPYAGRLESITDRNGNRITFYWETSTQGVERIDYAIDTLGHTINFIYHNELYNGQLSSLWPASPSNDDAEVLEQLIWVIEDQDTDRAFEYGYSDPFGRPALTSVIEPAIEDSASFPLPVEHERFQNGRTWTYTYDTSGNLGSWWDGRMLTSITSPNGDVILENEYYSIPGTFNRNSGRVVRQKYGAAEYNYVVTTLDGTLNLPSHGGTGPDYYVWVNDRRGAITRFKYAGTDNSTTIHRQLLEKKEFDGVVADANKSVFAAVDGQGNPTAWYTLDEADYAALPYSGPVLPDSTPATDSFVWTWDTNQDWNPIACYHPTGDIFNTSYADSTTTDDPRKWGAKTQVQSFSFSTSEYIYENWAYNFDFSGGCGCGVDNFDTGYSDGRGITTIKQYDTALNPVTGNAKGDLLFVFHDLTSGTINTDPSDAANWATAIDEYTYNDHGQVLTHKHPAKTILNAQGQEETKRRLDQFEYHDAPGDLAKHGRLHKKHIDLDLNGGGLNLTTVYEYDEIGNVIKETHPDNDVSEYLYNQASQLVRVQHYDDGNASSRVLFAQSDYFYDANGNLVREELLNLAGDPPVVQGNQAITTVHEYDIHDFRTRTSREHGDFSGPITEDSTTGEATAPITDTKFATEQWDFDGAKNLIKYHNGQAVNQTQDKQLSNTVEYEYDARDLLIKKKQGDGVGIGDTLVTTADYDDRGRPTDIYINQGDLNHEQHYSVVYDGFNRVMNYTDPMGNQMSFEYDQNHNVVESYFTGPVSFDLTNSTESSYTLYSQSYEYDNRDRMTLRSIDIFDYDYTAGTGPVAGPGPHGSSQQTTSYEYNRDSSAYSISETSGDATTDKLTKFFYDTASRLEFIEDNDFNTTAYEYDAESNIERITRSEQSTLTGGSAEVYTVDQVFDTLDRLVSSTDGAGNFSEFKYDSRSNMVELVNPRENITRLIYDGMNRLTETQVDMTDTGVGIGTVIGTIITKKEYDDSSRLVKDIDDVGNPTTYTYDGLNRLSSTTMPDGAVYTTTYDDNGNMAVHTDARGLVISHDYDRNNRLYKRYVDGTEIESYLYDGLGRVRRAQNDFARVDREYDSRSNVIEEIQNVDAASGFLSTYNRVVEYSFDDANNTSQMVYPNGRVIDRSYDHLNRLLAISDPSMVDPITQLDYIGNRLQRRSHGNGTQTDYQYNGYAGFTGGGDLGFGRIASISTTDSTTSAVLDAFDFAWDANQSRTEYMDTGSGMDNRRERLFGYDSSDRLTSSGVVYPESSATKIDDTTSYILDDDHNRLDVTELLPSNEGDAGAGLGIYELDGNQALNNQYSVTPREDGSEWAYQYDANGNMTLMALNVVADFTGDYTLDFFDVSAFITAVGNQDPEADINGDGSIDHFDTGAFLQEYAAYPEGDFANRHYTYDFRNQLTSVEFRTGPTAVDYSVVNTYDAFARRVTEVTDGNGVVSSKQMVYGCESLWEVIEQIDLSSGQTLTTHVFGLGIDDEVGYRVENASPPDKDIWAHRDDLGSLTSITNSNGLALERYEYGDYGLVTIMNETGAVRGSSLHNAFHLYTGRALIAGTGLYDYRYRVMDPVTGRFVQRDPYAYIDAMNLYTYVANRPVSARDPSGCFLTVMRPGQYNRSREAAKEQARQRNKIRTLINRNLPQTPQEGLDNGWHWAPESENGLHRNSDPENRKMLPDNPTDPREQIFGPDDNPVDDPRDRPTGNICPNGKSPIGHLIDVYDWLKVGTGPDDPSTEGERLLEFIKGTWNWIF